MKKYLLPALLFLVLSSLAAAAEAPLWLRYPAISPDGETIVFTYKGDLYRVDSDGGQARLLTLHEAHDFMPVWSHDGSHIAFASDRFGNFDIYVMPAEGGQAKRVTFHSAAEYPYTFSPSDDEILFGSARLDTAEHRGFPTGSQPELYRVSVQGGRVFQVLTTPAEDVQLSRDGRYLVYHDKKGGENEWRKHHRSAITRDLWIYDTQTGAHRRITSFEGEDRNPVFTQDEKALYYLSEESGSFNVYRIEVSGGRAERLTSFQTHPIRFLTMSSNGVLCFNYDGEIYTMRGRARPRKVDIEIVVDAKSNNQRVLAVTSGASDLAVSPTGKEVAFVHRGEIFVTSVEGGVTKRITDTPEEETDVSFSPGGDAIVYSSERGTWNIYKVERTREEEPYFYASTVLEETPLVESDRESYQPSFSPDGKQLAFVEDRMTLKILDLESQQTRTLLTDEQLFSSRDHGQYFRWSPDSKWILFDYSVPGLAPGEIGVVRADGEGEVVNLTQSGFDDRRAKWILGGKAMLWFSNRDGLKSVAQSGTAQFDVYGLFFSQEAWDRFNLSKEDAALLKEMEEKEKNKKKDEAGEEQAEEDTAGEELSIDWEGLNRRKARFTIHSSSLGDALVRVDGEMLYYLARFERGMNLWSTNLRTRETKMLADLNASGGRMAWDKDQKNIFLLANGRISKIDPKSGKRESVGFRGEMTLDVAAERRLMFDHVWRRTRKTFYTEGYHGVDWQAYRPLYEKYLDHIGTGYEFAEMLSELLGELNVSHSGARYRSSDSGDDETASLGVFYDYSYQGDGIQIAEIIAGGPLDKAGIELAPGMIIESIDGGIVAANRDSASYLNRKADKKTLLVIRDGEERKEIVVTPISLGAERRLLYDRWVRRNQQEVDRLSNGQLGYVHVPGMNDGAYRDTYEEVMGKYANRKGIVVDTRFNGGGDLVADLAMFLSGDRFFDYTTDKRSAGFEPNFRWTKPSVTLANEANYSDGHCYAFTYKSLGLGKLVGMPVPGTCTFAGWEMLQDQRTRWGVPPVGVKDNDGNYLENRQTEPDIKLMNEYDVVSQGRDQQLEAAVSALLEEIGN